MNSVEKRAILGVGGIFALRMIGLFMIVPVFSVYGDNYAHATPFLIGLAVGIYGLGQAIFQIPMSLAADKFPRKPIIFLGLILFPSAVSLPPMPRIFMRSSLVGRWQAVVRFLRC